MPDFKLNRSAQMMVGIGAIALVLFLYKADSRLREMAEIQREMNYQTRAMRYELETQNPDHPRGGLGESEEEEEDETGEELDPEEAGDFKMQVMDPEEETVEEVDLDGLTGPEEDEPVYPPGEGGEEDEPSAVDDEFEGEVADPDLVIDEEDEDKSAGYIGPEDLAGN